MGSDLFGRWLNDDRHVAEPTNTRIHGAVPQPGRQVVISLAIAALDQCTKPMPIVYFLRPQQAHHMRFDQFGRWLNNDRHVVEPTNTRIHGAVPQPGRQVVISTAIATLDQCTIAIPIFGVCYFIRPQQAHHMGFDQFGRWLNEDKHVVEPTNTRIHGAVP